MSICWGDTCVYWNASVNPYNEHYILGVHSHQQMAHPTRMLASKSQMILVDELRSQTAPSHQIEHPRTGHHERMCGKSERLRSEGRKSGTSGNNELAKKDDAT